MNMLSVSKVKEHGISDKRWETKDKKSQYKSIVKLYTREMEFVHNNTQNSISTTAADIRQLTKVVKLAKLDLYNKMAGSRLQIDKVLMLNHGLRLKYKRLPPDVIIEQLKQDVYDAHRKLDRMRYQRKKQSNYLGELKLTIGQLQDKIKYKYEKLETDRPCKKVTGQIQDALLLAEAAIEIRNRYYVIIQLLQKDSYCYNHLMHLLELDVLAQNKCLMEVIVLGQVATEYLDDRKRELITLKTSIKASVAIREDYLKAAQRTISAFPKRLRHCIRADEDVAVFPAYVNVEDNAAVLIKDITYAESILSCLKTKTFTSTYQNILPVLQEQLVINEKFKDRKSRYTANVEKLTKLVEHAKVIVVLLRHNNQEIIDGYLHKNNLLKQAIRNQNLKKKRCEEQKLRFAEKIAEINYTVGTIDNLCNTKCNFLRSTSEVKPAPILHILKKIEQKLASIIEINDTVQINITRNVPKTFSTYWESQDCYAYKDSQPIKQDELEDEMFREDPLVLTRRDIKQQSKNIVAYFKSLEL